MDIAPEPGAPAAPSPPDPAGAPDLVTVVLRQLLSDAHHYSPGVEHRRPSTATPAAGARTLVRDRIRDVVERVAGRAGFSRRHFDPEIAAAEVTRLIAQSAGLQTSYGLLADEPSRQALVDLVKLRALGPYHSPLRVTPAEYRARQQHADRTLRRSPATFHTPDPFFSSLSLYELPVPGGAPIRLHSHSVDVVSVYLLDQYSYLRGAQVAARDGDVVLDVGGCFGDTALYFASRIGPSGRVYTFEFDPVNLEVLRANLGLNPELAARIEIVPFALWDVPRETLRFTPAGRTTSLALAGASPGSASVLTTTVDEFVAQRGLGRVDFIKLDVEGAEGNVLRGAGDSLARFRPALALAAYHRDDDLIELPQLIDSLKLGYRFWLDSFSSVQEETVLFAASRNSST